MKYIDTTEMEGVHGTSPSPLVSTGDTPSPSTGDSNLALPNNVQAASHTTTSSSDPMTYAKIILYDHSFDISYLEQYKRWGLLEVMSPRISAFFSVICYMYV